MYLGATAAERRATRAEARATRQSERDTARAQRQMMRTDRMADRFAQRMSEPLPPPSQEIPGVFPAGPLPYGQAYVEASGNAVMPAAPSGGGMIETGGEAAAPAESGGSTMPLLLGAGLLLSLLT